MRYRLIRLSRITFPWLDFCALGMCPLHPQAPGSPTPLPCFAHTAPFACEVLFAASLPLPHWCLLSVWDSQGITFRIPGWSGCPYSEFCRSHSILNTAVLPGALSEVWISLDSFTLLYKSRRVVNPPQAPCWGIFARLCHRSGKVSLFSFDQIEIVTGERRSTPVSWLGKTKSQGIRMCSFGLALAHPRAQEMLKHWSLLGTGCGGVG